MSTISSKLHRVGSIVGVFGVKGELKLDATDAGAPLIVPDAMFLARPRERYIKITAARLHKGRLLVRLLEAPTIAEAESYVGAVLFAPREAVDAALDREEILDIDLIGTELFDVHGAPLGRVMDVAHYPASAMLFVGPRRTLIPFVKAYILSFDRAAKRMVLDLPAGFFEP